ncbi:MAG: ABC transporter substrate-binding protein [Acidobacteria bacterium]|nr:ABC transporter substrate-binding protein [Acidobacteriota bacterium]
MRGMIRLAHSPDSDDAFMFYALATEKIDTAGLRFKHELRDIESLNQAALKGEYEVSAVSIHAYAYLHERYALLDCGASMGEDYGPLLIASNYFPPEDLKGRTVAIPGERTSAFLALKLFEPALSYRVVPFDEIIPALQSREADAGLIIHEGQILYRELGFHKILDLGHWWKNSTGLPLPLGGLAVRRDLGVRTIRQISGVISQSIAYALQHREEALHYALQFGRGLSSDQADRFVAMYVNERTLSYQKNGRKAVQLFLDRGYETGIISHRVKVTFV